MAASLHLLQNTISDVHLAIFDKDGTLIDIHTYWANMVRLRAERITEALGISSDFRAGIMDAMGVDVSTMRIKPEGPVGLKKREIVLNAGVSYLMHRGIADTEELFIRVFADVDELSLTYLNDFIKPLPGLTALFDALREKDVAIALATTDKTDRAWLCMRHLGLDAHIGFIAGADAVKNPKPAPDVVELCCTQLSIPSHLSVMVGDAKSDVLAGIAAKCSASIGVESGLTSPAELAELTPFVIQDISQIIVR